VELLGRSGVIPLLSPHVRLVLPVAAVGLLALAARPQKLGRQRLGLAEARDRDVPSRRLAKSPGATGPGRAYGPRQLCGAGSDTLSRAPGAGDDLGNGAPGEEQRAADEHQRGEDVRAQALEERRRRPVQGVSRDAAVAADELQLEVAVPRWVGRAEPEGPGREREQERRAEEQAARDERPRGAKGGACDQRASPRGERERREVGDAPAEVDEPRGDPGPYPAAIATEVQDESQVDRRRDRRQPDEVVM